MHAWLDLKVHLGDEFVTVRAVDRDDLEDDVFREHNLCTLSRMLLLNCLRFLRCLFNVSRGLLCDHDSLVSAVGKVVKHLVHLVDERGVAGQVLHFFVRDNETSDRLSQVDQERGVAYVVLCDLSLVIAEFGEVLTGLRAKNWKTNDCVADHHSAILNKHAVIDAHQESLFEDEADV